MKFVSIAAVFVLLVALSGAAWFNLGSGGGGNGDQSSVLAAPSDTGSASSSCDVRYMPSQGYATTPTSATCDADEWKVPTAAYTVPAKSDCKV
ncbi:MAG TPA: hypothetical protein VFQ54_00110, partial [Thermomicrobiales bacterium]|nr:hypothetical protein [Thermomicrobiales bacterium]